MIRCWLKSPSAFEAPYERANTWGASAATSLPFCFPNSTPITRFRKLRSASLLDYNLLTAAEIPPIAIGEVSSPTPRNPLGAKGVGEGGAIGTLAAVANAVSDALGGRHDDPPYLEETLWRQVAR